MAQKGKKDQPDLAVDTHLFLGGGSVRGNTCVQASLAEWLALELSREAAILKERRKAREERNLRAPKG